MTVKSVVRGILAIVTMSACYAAESIAHEIVGVTSYFACQSMQARAFLRSPNPGPGNQDFPLVVLDSTGAATGEQIVVLSLENASSLAALVTAVGFAWPGESGGFQLVQLHSTYNELTTNNGGVRTGTIGPDDYTVLPSLVIAPAQGGVELSIRENVRGIPGFPHTTLDFAIVTDDTFSGGRPDAGLATDATRHVIAFKGRLPVAAGSADIEGLLNDAHVRFRRVGPDGEGAETGIWRMLLPAVTCSGLSPAAQNDAGGRTQDRREADGTSR